MRNWSKRLIKVYLGFGSTIILKNVMRLDACSRNIKVEKSRKCMWELAYKYLSEPGPSPAPT